MHQCPALECPIMIRDELLACGPHWKLVPEPLQDAVYKTWRKRVDTKKYRDIRAHQAACRAAVSAMNRKMLNLEEL